MGDSKKEEQVSDPFAATVAVDSASISTAVINTEPRLATADDESFTAIREPRFAERYALRTRLGAGGMGEVKLVSDAGTGRDIAMKVMRARDGGLSPRERARFLREARVQAQLEHPAIVPVYDIGTTPDGVEYFTMKRIDGKTLADVIDALSAGDEAAQREYPRNKLLGIFRQVCLAVEYAHRRGVVHRDLKPDNVMLEDLGEVYVLDWGIAKVRDLDDTPLASPASVRNVPRALSMVGSILGTPGYMSPEQASGRPDLDQRSDVYALGAILFEILTLEPLVHGATAQELIERSIRGSDVRERLQGSDLPPELVELCAEATRMQRDERLDSAQGLADGVQRFLDGDRDAALRSELADRHASSAEEAAERAAAAGSEGIAERQRALKEAGRALALDPTSARAAAVMMRLLLEPPPEIPPEVEDEVVREETAEARVTARTGVGTYFMNGLTAIIAAWVLGLRDYRWLIAIVVPQWLACLTCIYVARRDKIVAAHALVVGFLAFLAIGADSGIAGPLILVPGYAAAQVIILSMARIGAYRYAVLAMGILSVAIPVALEYTGWITPAYEFLESGGLHVRPRFVELPPLALPLGAAAAVITALVGPAIVGFRQGDVLGNMRRQVHLQSWMLRQLVPDTTAAGAPAASLSSPPPGALRRFPSALPTQER